MGLAKHEATGVTITDRIMEAAYTLYANLLEALNAGYRVEENGMTKDVIYLIQNKAGGIARAQVIRH